MKSRKAERIVDALIEEVIVKPMDREAAERAVAVVLAKPSKASLAKRVERLNEKMDALCCALLHGDREQLFALYPREAKPDGS